MHKVEAPRSTGRDIECDCCPTISPLECVAREHRKVLLQPEPLSPLVTYLRRLDIFKNDFDRPGGVTSGCICDTETSPGGRVRGIGINDRAITNIRIERTDREEGTPSALSDAGMEKRYQDSERCGCRADANSDRLGHSSPTSCFEQQSSKASASGALAPNPRQGPSLGDSNLAVSQLSLLPLGDHRASRRRSRADEDGHHRGRPGRLARRN
jgi:hypothetical protein